MKHFKAPWSTTILVISTLATALCLVLALMFLFVPFPTLPILSRVVGLFPLIGAWGAALFTIRGYTITTDAILVHRLFWITTLNRADMQSAHSDPIAMKWSIRLCGNGGWFSFTGWFWNKRIGTYRAFVTDPRRAVVIRDANRTLVLSPENPEEFIRELALGEPQK